jgi:3-keto-disaccharide hydrolase
MADFAVTFLNDLKGRVDAGGGGFAVAWQIADINNMRLLRLGYFGNARHELTQATDGQPDSPEMFTQPGSIDPNRWYDVRIEVRGDESSCYLDGEALWKDSKMHFPSGRVGLGAYATAMRFKDIRVTSEDGKTVYWQGPPKLPSESATATAATGAPATPATATKPTQPSDAGPWTQKRFPAATVFDGTWKIDGADLVQSSRAKQDTRVIFGDPSWSRYNIQLKAMAGEGSEGCVVLFNYLDRDNFRNFTLGAWKNTSHDVSSRFQAVWDPGRNVNGKPGSLQRNRWYTVRIEVREDACRCFLNGQLWCQNSNDNPTKGQIALGTWGDTIARFRDVVVTSEDGKTVLWKGNPQLPPPVTYEKDKVAPTRYTVQDGHILEGTWTIDKDELVQSSLDDRIHELTFGDPTWTNYNLALKAKVTEGPEGFRIYFNYVDRENFRVFTAGAWTNTANEVIAYRDGRWDGDNRKGRAAELKKDRWYDVRVEVRGPICRCLLDGELWFEQTDTRFKQGCVGLGSPATNVRFRDIKVTSVDGTILWEGLPKLPGN